MRLHIYNRLGIKRNPVLLSLAMMNFYHLSQHLISVFMKRGNLMSASQPACLHFFANLQINASHYTLSRFKII